MSDARPLVRGRALLGPLRYYKEARGADALLDLGNRPELAGVLRARIGQSAWYPYDAYVALLVALDRDLGTGDLRFCRKLGEWAGTQDLGSMFRIYAKLASADRLIRSCKLVWPQYYRNAGEMEALSTWPHDTRLRITGFPSMHRAHCRLMEGWMIATMGQIGCRVSSEGREVACVSEGAPHHEFACTWTHV